MEIISSIVGKVVELAIEPLGRQLSYLCFIHDNIQKLKTHIEMLKETREIVQHKVYDARRNVEDIKPSVQNWLAKVDAIIERSEEILTNEGQQNRFCLNLVKRHKLSRKAVKMANGVLEMKNEGNFDKVSYSVTKYESTLTKTSDFLHFESRRSTKKQIMDELVAGNFNKIGIYGMGGVGKTMIVKEILREVMEKKLFDVVVTLTISQTPNLKEIQGELAEKLGLNFKENSIEGRALKLHKRLVIEKTSLIVFDDIWAPIDMETIGIPSDVDHKGCKILFTSRDKHTLSNDMCIDKIFEIKVVHEDEALNLFKKIVGEMVEAIDFKDIVNEIVRECSNLPIAIVTVAKALRNKPISIWKDALDQLRNPQVMNIKGMNDKVYALLKLSYWQLEREAKMLFLLCSMFSEDYKIDVKPLHIWTMAFDFLHGVDTVTKRRHRLTKLVDDLTSSSLLQNCEDDNDCIKMHDLVRDVAISIASKDDQVRTLSYGKNRNEWEKDEVSGNYTAVYLNFANYQNSKLIFPKVKLLIIEGRRNSCRELSLNILEEMKALKVLALRCIKISLLPQCFHSFINVRSLHLIFCELENIDMIGKFKKLEILSFKGSNITQIPITISQLTQLKVLDLSSCSQLKVVPPNVLSKLTKLEELKLKTFSDWEKEELHKERKSASIFELKNLTGLSTLCLSIKDEKVMPRQMFSAEFKLEKFNISIGSPQKLFHHHEEIIRKKFYLKMESGYCMNDGIKTLLKRSEKLHLEGSFGANIFLSTVDENESSHLKHLDLLNICGLQYIIHSQKQPFGKVLSNLVHLCLKGLNNLVCIVHGYDRKSPFNKLKFVRVEECKKLAGIFLNCNVDDLSNLEKIKIHKCEMMEVIVAMTNEGATKKIEFTHLKTLKLCCLKQLQKFSSKIEKDGTNNFSNNDSFFSEEISIPNLKKLKIEKVGNLKLICGNILFPNSFSKLAKVCIDSCNNLEKVFSWRMMRILASLKSISITNCNLLKGIFEAQETNVIKESVDLLPQLLELKLSELPNLQYVWSEDPCELVAFENMETLCIYQCPKLSKESVINVLPQLKHLETDLNSIEVIFEKERSKEASKLQQLNTFKVESLRLQDDFEKFSKLKTLKLYGSLDYHKTHLSLEILPIFPCLDNLQVGNALIEEIFPSESLISVKEHQCTTSDRLHGLDLFELPKLKHLWKEGSKNNNPVLLQHLDYLNIYQCGILNINFVPSSVSFRNLTYLYVDKCHRMTHLLNPSVAKILVQLDYLEIQKCKRMNTIIDHVGGVEEGNEEIVFNKLRLLTLQELPKLTSFHSGRCIIKFPCLGLVQIVNCREMKNFSLGSISTPHLNPKAISISNNNGRRFYPNDSKGMIVEDINAIIRKNWEEEYFDNSIPYLFTDKNLDENQSGHSSSHVEEQ